MRTLLALSVAALLGGCAIIVSGSDGDVSVRTPFSSDAVQGDGLLARDQRTIGDVSRLEVNGSVLVDVRVGPAPSLVVEADGNLLPLVRTDVRGDTLVVEIMRSYRTRNPVRVTYTAPRLADVQHSGSGHLTVQGLDGGSLRVVQKGSGSTLLGGRVAGLDVDSSGSGSVDAAALQSASARLSLSGSGRLNAGQVRGDYVTATLTGSGQLRAGGAVRMLTARSVGSGHLDLANLASEQAELTSTGSGGLSANVRQLLVAQNNGSGGIRIYGNPAQRSVNGKPVQMVN
jgi:hypothetical protein